MKIVNIIGGLGNQMFQYAFYLALKKHYIDEEIKIHIGAYNGYGRHNAYELDKVFGINAPIATISEVARLAYPYINYRLWQIGNHLLPIRCSMFKEQVFGRFYNEVFDLSRNCYYEGYWQNENYFSDMRNELIRIFTPTTIDDRNKKMARSFHNSKSVSIHVRHGDFLKKDIYKGICDLDYYRKALDKIQNLTDIDTFCLFSNDIEWCNKHIIPLLNGKNVVVADWNKGSQSYLDLYLMSHCHHNIIAHSSFSWWGAWLNQHSEKIVIGPSRWNNIPTSEFELCPSWIKIRNL